MHPLVNIAVRAARQAGQISLRGLNRLDKLDVERKGHNDYVSEVDLQAERAIIDVIHKNHPSHGILAEESGHEKGDGEHLWIIDPLDGTTNYLHGFPAFAISVAFSYHGQIQHGVVYDPLREELYSASRGSGAQLNNQRLRVSNRHSLATALIGTGFPFRQQDNLDTYLAMFRQAILHTAGVRRAGAAALDLAWTAAGRLDGFFELGLKPWDIAAGSLLIQEAGGMVGNINGKLGNLPEDGNILAANPRLFRELAEALAGASQS